MKTLVTNRFISLSLNAHWQALGYRSVKSAITALAGSDAKDGRPETLAMDITYEMIDDVTPNYESAATFNPVTWSEWIELPIRPWDLYIQTPKRNIRVPTVTISTGCKKMPKKTFKGAPSKTAIKARDHNIDQYTGEKILKREDITIDHVIPRKLGGKNTWENLVVTSRRTNQLKNDKLMEEVGLSLIRKPNKPGEIPLMYLIKDVNHPDWNFFLKN